MESIDACGAFTSRIKGVNSPISALNRCDSLTAAYRQAGAQAVEGVSAGSRLPDARRRRNLKSAHILVVDDDPASETHQAVPLMRMAFG